MKHWCFMAQFQFGVTDKALEMESGDAAWQSECT